MRWDGRGTEIGTIRRQTVELEFFLILGSRVQLVKNLETR
jgi:hypothetical protein